MTKLPYSMVIVGSDYVLSSSERQEAEGLVELAEFLSLLSLRSTRVSKSA